MNNKEFLIKWVAELRSSKYVQGRGEWFNRGKHCCLGVANAISGEELNYSGIIEDEDCLYNTTLKLGLTHSQLVNLSNMNDMGRPFSEIADFIEKNYIHDSNTSV